MKTNWLSKLSKIINKSPVAYAPVGVPTMPWGHRNDATTQMEAISSVSTLFSIVNRTSNATSQIEWHLYRKPVDGRRVMAPESEPQRTEVTRHAALDLWNNPNPFTTGNEFVEACQQHMDLTGETTIVVVRHPLSSMPLELWPVRPDRMQPVPHPTDYLAGWVYTGPDGEKVPLGVDEVIQIKMPNPMNPYRGMGPVQAALVDLQAFQAAAAWNLNFFRNSAEPGGIIESPLNLDDEQFNMLQERWREQHQGIDNAHRVAILEGGVKWVERGYSPKDMQFSELRNVSRELIREAFGIHGHILGLTEDINRSNADAAEVSFARWLVYPRAQRWKAMLNSKLLPMYGPDTLEFDHNKVVPEDREADDRERTSKANAAAVLAGAGKWDPADILTAVGLPPMTVVETPAVPAATPAAFGGKSDA